MTSLTWQTRAEVAQALGISERTLKRRLPGLMARHPNLRVSRIGRTVAFTPAQLRALMEAMEWRCPTASEAPSGTRAARSASDGKPSKLGNSAQDAVREQMLKLLGPTKKPAFAATSLKVMQGGRAG
jgi:hypothetical protein